MSLPPSTPSIETFHPAGYPAAPPNMSHVLRAGDMVYTSGQIALDLNGCIPSGFEDQVIVALENLGRCLEAAGAKVSDIVHIRYYIVDFDPTLTTQPHNKYLLKFLNGHRPCCTLVPVPYLAKTEFKFEIEAVAAVSV
ncbi:hypothetical protein BP5796_09835 [Coleophoma crateriformis]|uniref:YjgF-like protein n=1 Tax=Coleophoma crateriformis TaxID=565419 RepID=A0A3D8QTJ2_9HELO|nr:hypothetical protein BP5796_09835 [Coleophoma crateriformis]